MEEMISITDAGKLLGISRPRLSKLIKEKKLPKKKKGGTYLVNRDQVTSMVMQLRDEGRIRVGGTIQDESEENITEENILKDSELIADFRSRIENLEEWIKAQDDREKSPRNTTNKSFFKSMFKSWG